MAGCAAATWWQARRALAGNGLSWFYTFEWPIFAGIAIAAWWHLIHEDPEARAARSAGAGGEVTRPTVRPSGERTGRRLGTGRPVGSDRAEDGLVSLTVWLRGVDQCRGRSGTLTLPGAAAHPKRSQDRLFKWVAAVAAACLIGFVSS